MVNTPLSDPSFTTSLITTGLIPREQAEKALENYKDKRISELMKTESTALVENYHAFGFPWMVIERSDGQIESFFGSDRFTNIAWWSVHFSDSPILPCSYSISLYSTLFYLYYLYMPHPSLPPSHTVAHNH